MGSISDTRLFRIAAASDTATTRQLTSRSLPDSESVMTVTLASTNGAHGANGANGHARINGRHGNDDYLKVVGSDITLNGKPILLKGASLGGWSELILTTR